MSATDLAPNEAAFKARYPVLVTVGDWTVYDVRGGAVTPLASPASPSWPLLFLVPGWIVVRRVAPDLPTPGAVGVAVVASVYLSAHVVDVVARLVGFGLPAVVVSARS